MSATSSQRTIRVPARNRQLLPQSRNTFSRQRENAGIEAATCQPHRRAPDGTCEGRWPGLLISDHVGIGLGRATSG